MPSLCRRLPCPAEQRNALARDRTDLFERGQNLDDLLPYVSLLADGTREQVEDHAQFLGQVRPVRLLLMQFLPHIERDRQAPTSLLRQPGLDCDLPQPL